MEATTTMATITMEGTDIVAATTTVEEIATTMDGAIVLQAVVMDTTAVEAIIRDLHITEAEAITADTSKIFLLLRWSPS